MLFDSRIKKAAAQLRSIEPPAERVNLAKDLFRGGNVRVSRVGRWVGLGLAVGVAGFAIIFLSPRANAFEAMRQSLASVPASHSRTLTAKGRLMGESWREGVKRRYQSKNGEHGINRGYDGKVVWHINFGKGYAVISGEKSEGFGALGTTFEEELQVIKLSGGDANPTVTSETRKVEGKPTLVITLVGTMKWSYAEKIKWMYFCRPEDRLPYKIERYRFRDGKEALNVVTLIDYPSDIPDDFFSLPKDSKLPVLDSLIAKRSIINGLAGRSPSKTVQGVQIDLLGAFQDANGTLYVLWCGGEVPPMGSKAAILDAHGKGYEAMLCFETDDRNRPRNHGAPPKVVKKSQQEGKIIDIRPLALINGKRVYAMQAHLPPSFLPQKLTITIPVAKKLAGAGPILKTQYGASYRSPGEYVGGATFEADTIPVEHLHYLIQELDPKGLKSWSAAPLSGSNSGVPSIRFSK